MARQYILSGFPFAPTFINETVTNQHIMPVVFLNETSGGTPPPPAGNNNLLPLMGVGAREPNAVDLLVSGALFAGLLAKENPTVNRRKFLTGGTKE